MTKLVRTISFLLLFAGAALGVSAQVATARLFGTVADSTGAAIPKANITLTQTETNAVRTLVTKDDGSYNADFLPVGPYKLSVSAPGFKALDRSGIVLSVMQEANLNLTLEVGASNETVNVTSDVPLVNLGSSVLGATVTNEQVENLPLVSRDTYQLLDLTPGVQQPSGSSPKQNTLGYEEYHVYINGSTDDVTGQVAYYLDGGLNMTGLRNSGNQIPNPDAIREFNVETNNFCAQLGRYSAAVISVVTKSGTNAFHGSAFYFYRDKNFNAVTHNTSVKTPYTRQQFGGTVGGPIRRDKDFFFASLGALRSDTGANYTGNVPSAAQRTGNFMENLATDITNCTQSPTAADNAAFKFLVCNPATHTPYTNNIITTALDPTAVNILANLKDVPLPNPT